MTDLLSRLSAATGPSRELDAEIALANGWTQTHFVGGELAHWLSPTRRVCPNPPRYTESIDAALTLVPEGIYWAVCSQDDCFCAVISDDLNYIGDYLHGPGVLAAATPAIALVIACLKAKVPAIALVIACLKAKVAVASASVDKSVPFGTASQDGEGAPVPSPRS